MPSVPVTLSTAPPPPGALDLDGLSLHVGIDDGGEVAVERTAPAPGLTEVVVEVPAGAAGRTLVLDWQLPVGGATGTCRPSGRPGAR
jgi:hypothetical protein